MMNSRLNPNCNINLSYVNLIRHFSMLDLLQLSLDVGALRVKRAEDAVFEA